jgi:hypothetical protein
MKIIKIMNKKSNKINSILKQMDRKKYQRNNYVRYKGNKNGSK